MFQIITVLIFLIYLGLVYKFRKDNIVLLLLTLIAILTLCNVKNVVEGQAPINNNNSKVTSNNSKVTSNNSKVTSNNSKVNSNNSKVNSNKNSVNGPKADDKLRFVVSADYQMGPYDGLVLTTGNEKSKYLKLNDVSLATKKDMCVYQGSELPLECNKTMFSGGYSNTFPTPISSADRISSALNQSPVGENNL